MTEDVPIMLAEQIAETTKSCLENIKKMEGIYNIERTVDENGEVWYGLTPTMPTEKIKMALTEEGYKALIKEMSE